MNPIDLLPIKRPILHDPSEESLDYFYDNVVKHLVPDVIRIMNNGIGIDLDEVTELESIIVDVLNTVRVKLAQNSIMSKFNAHLYPIRFKAHKERLEARKRDMSYYLTKYKATVIHRTYVVNEYLKGIDKEYLCTDSWKAKEVKELNLLLKDKFLTKVLDKTLTEEDTIAGMRALATYKLSIYNKSIDGKISLGTKEALLPEFNPASNKQKREFFEWLGVEPYALTHKGEPSWNRASIERLLSVTTDDSLREVLQLFIDHSFSAIIKGNFIEAFKRFTIDGTLYGNLKLFGAKTFRLTSNSPNLLNMPSTGSIYAKPLKKCFVAKKGYLIATADFAALEDRVIANLSKDKNKTATFLEGIDGHSLAATYYFKGRLKALIGDYTNHKEAATALHKLVSESNVEAKSIRQDSKPVTFGLSLTMLHYNNTYDENKQMIVSKV